MVAPRSIAGVLLGAACVESSAWPLPPLDPATERVIVARISAETGEPYVAWGPPSAPPEIVARAGDVVEVHGYGCSAEELGLSPEGTPSPLPFTRHSFRRAAESWSAAPELSQSALVPLLPCTDPEPRRLERLPLRANEAGREGTWLDAEGLSAIAIHRRSSRESSLWIFDGEGSRPAQVPGAPRALAYDPRAGGVRVLTETATGTTLMLLLDPRGRVVETSTGPRFSTKTEEMRLAWSLSATASEAYAVTLFGAWAWYDGRRWHEEHLTQGEVDFTYRSIRLHAGGEALLTGWCETSDRPRCRRSVLHLRRGRIFHRTTVELGTGDEIRAAARSSGGVLWLGTEQGHLFRVEGTSVVPTLNTQGLRDDASDLTPVEGGVVVGWSDSYLERVYDDRPADCGSVPLTSDVRRLWARGDQLLAITEQTVFGSPSVLEARWLTLRPRCDLPAP